MTTGERILKARSLFERATPLRSDCGRLCGSACCHPDESGKGGMLLLPGEAAFYSHCNWASIENSAFGQILQCSGKCPRNERPFGCRIFPLVIIEEKDHPTVAMDRRAWPVCPLMESGQEGLSPEFRKAAMTAALLLWEDPEIREQIRETTGLLEKFSMF